MLTTRNLAVENFASGNTTGGSNTATGYNSLLNNSVCFCPLYSNVAGTNNTAMGANALYTNTCGTNIALGATFSNIAFTAS
jgi:hypothetical protein